tara:strand:+ start:537 stop:1097 length:561 start_codon:yes stop_codon:yes gene_type:complete
MKINTTTKKRFVIPAIIISLAIVTGGLVTYAYITDSWPFSENTKVQEDPTGADINLSPPTEQEIEASQDAKKRLDNDTAPDENTSSDKDTVGVGIAFAGVRNDSLEVRAFTNGIISGDGVCTITVSRGSTAVERQAAAFIDASSTQCQPVKIPVSELTPGTWDVRVTFDSPSAQGQSETVAVEVQG